MFVFCFFKQKTAYERRSRDWSSDVCSSDLLFARLSHEMGAVGAGVAHIFDQLRRRGGIAQHMAADRGKGDPGQPVGGRGGGKARRDGEQGKEGQAEFRHAMSNDAPPLSRQGWL